MYIYFIVSLDGPGTSDPRESSVFPSPVDIGDSSDLTWNLVQVSRLQRSGNLKENYIQAIIRSCIFSGCRCGSYLPILPR